MFTNPAQLLVVPLLGLVALCVFAGALVLLGRSMQPRQPLVLPPGNAPGAPRAPVAVGVESSAQRAARRLALVAAVLLLVWVFFGRFALEPFVGRSSARASTAMADARVAGPDGQSLQVSERGPRGGPTLVMTHGWGADRRDWDEVIDALPADLHVVTWDLPGLGRSSGADDARSMAAMADDLDAVVQARAGGGPVILVGHSIGGMLNLEYMRRHADRAAVKGMVEVDTTFTNPLLTKSHSERSRRLQPVYEVLLHGIEATAPLCRGLGWLAWSSGLAHIELAMQSFAGRETWAQLDDMARFAYRSDPRVVAEGVVAMMHWDASDELPRVTVPTLVLAGAQDRTTLPAASERMARDIPAAQLSIISPAAHLGPVESGADYARKIAEFVQQRSQPS